MAFPPDRGRHPGQIPQILYQNQIPGQGRDDVLLPGAPARELQQNDMMNNANAVHKNNMQGGLAGLPRLQNMIKLDDDDQDENMFPLDQQEHDNIIPDLRRQKEPFFIFLLI